MKLDLDTRVAINQFIRQLELFRDLDPNMTAGQIVAFCHMALNGKATLKEIGEAIGVPEGISAIQRYSAEMTERGKLKDGKGHALLKEMSDPEDMRKVIRELTPKGFRLLNNLAGIKK